MKPSAIVRKTIPFMLIRLAAYVIFFIGMCIYAFIVLKILGAIEPKGFMAIILVALFGGGGWYIYRLLREYITYMIKAAHVAVVADMAIHGGVPEDFSMYQYGVSKVKKFFVASNALFVLDRLMAGAVRQIQRAIGGIGSLLSFIPGVKGIVNILNKFVDIILNYVDECIMAYIFLHEGQNVWKSACDGVVLYVQNWKTVLKTGAKILLFLVLFYVVAFFVFNGIFLGIISGAGAAGRIIAYILTILFITVIKWGVIDPIIMINMMCGYLKVAYGAEPSYDLHGKLQGMSKKFKEMVGKSNEAPSTGTGANPA
ncbi:MAG: hypothetical protein GX384_08420 [Clostridiaceae bacterium]|jgi:hypothetical protein|nr:hypothetical protein [Bacillota bacterium]NLI39351.1 hypothetical protein [Clostridiaceae bacterium]